MRSKKQSKKIKQEDMITSDWLFKRFENQKDIPGRTYNPNLLKQIAGDNIKTYDKQLNKGLAKKWYVLFTLLIRYQKMDSVLV